MRENTKQVIDKLMSAGVREKDIPDFREIESAPTGKKWNGRKPNGYHWELRKIGSNQYKVQC